MKPWLEFRHAETEESKEHHQMWLYVQMWFPLMTITLAAAICLGVVLHQATGKAAVIA